MKGIRKQTNSAHTCNAQVRALRTASARAPAETDVCFVVRRRRRYRLCGCAGLQAEPVPRGRVSVTQRTRKRLCFR